MPSLTIVDDDILQVVHTVWDAAIGVFAVSYSYVEAPAFVFHALTARVRSNCLPGLV